ncbi:MAG: glycoside hydrolase family 2 [Clostridiales bacterium]|jgi:beta-galactosidase/beta-glucuronidase|nr:glycoside hydrolase family 2 [Clostridiales bacterium]
MHNYKKDYPRPQLVRDNWENLNGTWDFAFDDTNAGEKEKWYESFQGQRKIQVPFTYETKASGIGEEAPHEIVWYKREITLTKEALTDKRLLLHFEGVDYESKVWINGQLAGTHRGGYARFSFDITDLVFEGVNTIVVRAKDAMDTQQPRGKQRWISENFGCWYVQTTGIWKTVWMEFVGTEHIRSLKITPQFADSTVVVEADIETKIYNNDLVLEAEVTFDGKLVKTMSCQVNQARAILSMNIAREDLFEWSIKAWSPNEPNLYDLKLVLKKGNAVCDTVFSYFGMREILIDKGNILLNGTPLYQRLILDQGYWKDSHLTPPNEEALIEDIDKIKELGYNGLRKHQKIEDERFLYWCDVKGMLVWSEMAAAYKFSDIAVEQFTKEWMEIVKQNYSHPCIITWTPFNESWGISSIKTNKDMQHFTEAIYYLTKTFDPYRPVIVNDGWDHTISDILTLHDYEELGKILFHRYGGKQKDKILTNEVYFNKHKSALANGYEYQGQPIIISEFGGIAFNNDDSGWGYGNKVNTKEDFIKRFDDITTAIKKLPYVCGYCYTQVTDVQQEINGLMDIDRNFKVEPSIIKEINERMVLPEY